MRSRRARSAALAGEGIRRKYNDRFGAVAWRLLIALVLVLLVAVGALTYGTVNNSRALERATIAVSRANTAVVAVVRQEATLHQQVLDSCVRLQIQRVIVNRLWAATQLPAAEKEWTPLTDCEAAVATAGSAYRLRSPIPFSVRRPPASALDINNAQKYRPVDSQ